MSKTHTSDRGSLGTWSDSELLLLWLLLFPDWEPKSEVELGLDFISYKDDGDTSQPETGSFEELVSPFFLLFLLVAKFSDSARDFGLKLRLFLPKFCPREVAILVKIYFSGFSSFKVKFAEGNETTAAPKPVDTGKDTGKRAALSEASDFDIKESACSSALDKVF